MVGPGFLLVFAQSWLWLQIFLQTICGEQPTPDGTDFDSFCATESAAKDVSCCSSKPGSQEIPCGALVPAKENSNGFYAGESF